VYWGWSCGGQVVLMRGLCTKPTLRLLVEIAVLARRLLKPSRFVGDILESKYWRSWSETSRQAKG